MQAIRTVYCGPSNVRGSRITATATAGRITVGYNYALANGLENHRAAAEALISKLGWTEPAYGTLVTGCLPDGSYCHTLSGQHGKGLD